MYIILQKRLDEETLNGKIYRLHKFHLKKIMGYIEKNKLAILYTYKNSI